MNRPPDYDVLGFDPFATLGMREDLGVTIRQRVILALTDEPRSGRQIAEHIGLTPKQVADALDDLYLMEKVTRIGRKSVARWRRQTADEAAEAERRRVRGRGGDW